jgi:hypothetical protein
MKLTKSEIEIADRYISKRERQLAQWPRRRWLLLVIYLLLALLGYGILSHGDRSIRDDKAMDMQVSQALEKDPPPGLEHRWAVGCMMKISKILEARHQVVTASLIEVVIGFMWLISGVSMVCLIILRWNRGERDALICKLLRGKLQELEPGAAPNGGPATLFASSGVTEGPPSVS